MKKVALRNPQYIFEDKYKIEEVHVRYEQYNGEMSEEFRRLSFERGDSVAALLYHEEQERYTLIEQFRYRSFPYFAYPF